MFIRLLVVLMLVAGLAGCGSMLTVNSEPSADVGELHLGRTYCTQLPRIYSGVAYNFCALYGDPGGAYQRDPSLSAPPADSQGIYWPLIDGVLSAATDTLALPYTIFRQQRDGSIELTHGN
ncbi:YceK/YidQ family lipoprotein [Pseudomonas knackmussii]|uniref:YceK/YidQ family lipoprotein n=1 Tax=Pseudomonas knackmussii TaxID=65741 RepID=UPI0013627A44|nr:YceK/YidQ family lipoprotein [Pseudomonas knackmussii]